MKTLPNNLTCHHKTPSFSADAVPKAILNRHNTKAGVWGHIIVESGALCYEIFQDETENIVETLQLTDAMPGVVEPRIWHRVTPLSDNTVFHVEFYRKDET